MIFGIGLGKTGLTSLTGAMAGLGYCVCQYPVRLDPLVWGRAEFVCDKPVNYRFDEVDRMYPGSRFILTLRPVEDWLASQKRIHGQPRAADAPERMHDLKCYGSDRYDEALYREAFNRHTERVMRYFEHRRQDLLVLNIFEGQGYPELVTFLGTPFPHRNRRSEKVGKHKE